MKITQYHNNCNGCSARDALSVAACTASATVILHIVKICVMFYTGPVDCYEILMILPAIILCCNANSNDQTHGIMLALFITIITVVLDAFRDVYMDV